MLSVRDLPSPIHASFGLDPYGVFDYSTLSLVFDRFCSLDPVASFGWCVGKAADCGIPEKRLDFIGELTLLSFWILMLPGCCMLRL